MPLGLIDEGGRRVVDATINLLAPYGAHVILMQPLFFIRNLSKDL